MDMNHSSQNPEQPLGTSVPNGPSKIEKWLKQMIDGLDKLIQPINRLLYAISKIVLFVLMLLTFFDVVGRNFFNQPITGTFELTGLAMVIIVFFSLGVTQLYKEHIEIGFFTDKLPKKAQFVLSTIIYLAVFIFLIVITYQFVVYTQRLMAGNDVSTSLRLPVYIFSIIATIGIAFFALLVVRDFFQSLLKVVKPDES